jgi:hypothetical protein
MALDFENSISVLSELDLWYRVTGGEELYLTDVPEIIRFRWLYFRDNWEFLKQEYINLIESYSDPQLLKTHIETFTEFVASQRNSISSRNPFDNDAIISRFYAIFDNTLISSVSLSYEEQKILDEKIRTIQQYTRGNFLEMREQLQEERDRLADKVSSTDEDYNRVFNRSAQAARVNITNKDLNKMYEIQEAIKAVDFVLANSFSLESSFIDPFALARSNANNPDIDIQTYFSGALAKLNYGEDLQALAGRTLDDPNKWIDIAITNGLKPPYIDEVGEKIPLISNASANQVNIAGVDASNQLNVDKLYVGQILLLQSDTQTFPEQRTVQNVKQVPVSGEIILELSGDSDLERYKLSENAYIRVYKPNTTNSSFFIMIPSDTPLEDDVTNDIPWFLQGSDGTEKRQKVDLTIGEDGDLVFNSTGDLQLSYGLNNAIQAVRLKMSVEAGELRRHPDYGLPNVSGVKNSDFETTREVLIDSITALIAADERFSNIENLDVEYNRVTDEFAASSVNVNLVVRLSGSGQLLPITFSIN